MNMPLAGHADIGLDALARQRLDEAMLVGAALATRVAAVALALVTRLPVATVEDHVRARVAGTGRLRF
jgi:hypothetical protein